HFANFVRDIDFAHLDLEPADITAGGCDAWARQSDDFAFGWVVNPKTSVARESFTLSGLADGSYDVRLYRTWRGRYLDSVTAPCRDGKLTVTIPELRTTGGHALHIGNDIAFKIRRQ
ncbi:MAG: hypothetical protein ACYTAS_09695, partial [Planctomycetota bacterium]